MPGLGPQPDAAAMITARDEFWDFERASYDDELDAWRERTTFTDGSGTSPNGHPQTVGRGSRAGAWSAARRQATRQGLPARTSRKAARIRIQGSARDRMSSLRG